MMVLADTPVWSIALRRTTGSLNREERELRLALERLIDEGEVALLGAVRQEILSGIREDRQFQRLRHSLRPFPNVLLGVEDYEEAARASNFCRGHGVAGSSVDFLICAVALLREWPILTTDQDFARYAAHLPIQLLDAGTASWRNELPQPTVV